MGRKISVMGGLLKNFRNSFRFLIFNCDLKFGQSPGIANNLHGFKSEIAEQGPTYLGKHPVNFSRKGRESSDGYEGGKYLGSSPGSAGFVRAGFFPTGQR